MPENEALLKHRGDWCSLHGFPCACSKTWRRFTRKIGRFCAQTKWRRVNRKLFERSLEVSR